MAILGLFTEDIDFMQGTSITVDTSSSHFRSSVRCAVHPTDNTDVATTKALSAGEQTSLWMTCQIYPYYFYSFSFSQKRYIGVCKSGGSDGIYIGWYNSKSRWALMKYSGTTLTLLAEEDGDNIQYGVLQRIDLQISSYGASGTLNLYVDGVLRVTYTGDISLSGVTGLDCLQVRNPNAGGFTSYNSVSEVIVLDSDTRNCNLALLYLNGAGDTNDWVGGYTNCDETTLSDADYVYTNTASGNFQANLSAMPAGEFGIVGIAVKARATASEDSAVSGLALGIKSGSTISVTTAQTLTTAWDLYEYIMDVNPVTGNPFSTTELNALQVDLQSAT
jgi:hypothetical protein